MEEGCANKLETEQEREQDRTSRSNRRRSSRRDQQFEIEQFVDIEYSMNEKRPAPWALNSLLTPPTEKGLPFYTQLSLLGCEPAFEKQPP